LPQLEEYLATKLIFVVSRQVNSDYPAELMRATCSNHALSSLTNSAVPAMTTTHDGLAERRYCADCEFQLFSIQMCDKNGDPTPGIVVNVPVLKAKYLASSFVSFCRNNWINFEMDVLQI
jgi:hypothetical protein